MFTFLLTCGGFCLLLHFLLLLVSFLNDIFHPRRYCVALVALWLGGAMAFCLALFYSGKHRWAVLDIFDTPVKKTAILLVVFSITLLIHGIVKFLVLPDLDSRYAANKRFD
jgi:hypothetical protein